MRFPRPSLRATALAGSLAAALLAAPGLAGPASAGAAPAGRIDRAGSAQGAQPYFAPPFRDSCTVQRFGEGEAPDPATTTQDPLCVEYAKPRCSG